MTSAYSFSMKDGTGLSDRHRSIISFIAATLIAVMAYMNSLPEEQKPDPSVFGIMGAVAVVAVVSREYFGVRDSTSAAIAKKVEPKSTNTRSIRDSVADKPTPVVE